jgi:hypothetical protein
MAAVFGTHNPLPFTIIEATAADPVNGRVIANMR